MEGVDWAVIFKLIAVVALVAANGFFVAAEFSLVAIRRSRIEQLANEGHPLGSALLKTSDKLASYLAATQLGITFSSLGLGWVGEPAIAAVIEPIFHGLPAPMDAVAAHAIAFVIAFALITFLHIVFGELVPKSLALQRAEAVSMAIVRPLAVFLIIFGPVISVLNGFANWVLYRAGLDPSQGEKHLHSPQELKLLFHAASQAGLIREVQGDLADRALALSERTIAGYMTPRYDFEWIDADAPMHSIRAQVMASRHSHFPIRIGSDGVPSMVSAKSILALNTDVDQLPAGAIEPSVLVGENARALVVLEQFRRNRIKWGLVTDEYGELQGLVTTDDLFDALAGESGPRPKRRPTLAGSEPVPVQLEEQVFDASLPIDEFRRLLNRPQLGIEDRDTYHTAAGFALSRLKRMPEAGTCFVYDDLSFEVRAMVRRRITLLAVSK